VSFERIEDENDDDDEEDCSSHRAKLKGGRERLRPNRAARVAVRLRMTPHQPPSSSPSFHRSLPVG
jgi:hypothetical protein